MTISRRMSLFQFTILQGQESIMAGNCSNQVMAPGVAKVSHLEPQGGCKESKLKMVPPFKISKSTSSDILHSNMAIPSKPPKVVPPSGDQEFVWDY